MRNPSQMFIIIFIQEYMCLALLHLQDFLKISLVYNKVIYYSKILNLDYFIAFSISYGIIVYLHRSQRMYQTNKQKNKKRIAISMSVLYLMKCCMLIVS